MALKNCPACGHSSIFVPLVPAVGYDGKLYGGKSEGFCNSPKCDQLLWYYPSTGQVTRRNVGVTLKDYWLRRADIDVFNSTRVRAGLKPVSEGPIAVLSLRPGDSGLEAVLKARASFGVEYADITEGDPALDDAPWYERAVDKIAGWYYSLFLKTPFHKDEDDG